MMKIVKGNGEERVLKAGSIVDGGRVEKDD